MEKTYQKVGFMDRQKSNRSAGEIDLVQLFGNQVNGSKVVDDVGGQSLHVPQMTS